MAQLNASFTPFEPETVTSYEVGAKSAFLDRRLRINAAVYYQDYANIQAQIRDFVGGIPVTLIRNAAAAKIYGGEIALTAARTSHLKINLGASYVHRT